MKIAIIGAGLSGSVLYDTLYKKNHDITLFEKSRGAGGRCSSRYIDTYKVDHGTPFFTINNPLFELFCQRYIQNNTLRKEEDIYYPIDGMNSICSSLIHEDDLQRNTKIVSAKFENNLWKLIDENGATYSDFDMLFITIPASQILELDMEIKSNIKEKLQTVGYHSIGTMLVYSHEKKELPASIYKNQNFKKVIDNSKKYEYKDFSSYVLHLNPSILDQHTITSKEDIEKIIFTYLGDDEIVKLKKDFILTPHYWKYAFVKSSLDEDCIFDSTLSLGFCGDYFRGDSIESAYLSAYHLSQNIKGL